MQRVVVTGIGVISPLGVGIEDNWSRLVAGESGIANIQGIDVSDMSCQIAGQIPWSRGESELSSWISPKEQRRIEPFIQYAAIASDLCFSDAHIDVKSDIDPCRTGVMVGSGTGGLEGIDRASKVMVEKGSSRVSPFFVPGSIINQASCYVAIRHRLFGPNLTVVTACASGAHAIGEAARLIADGSVDCMIAGGAEGSICRLGLSGFSAVRALSSSYNSDPTRASRPWDKDRDGFVMGEGACLLYMETLESALSRSAKIYCEVLGYGLSCDAHHLTAPSPDGKGVGLAIDMAMKRADCQKERIGYINAHATSTPMGDDIELNSIEDYFGNHAKNLAMSSTKGATGHLLGAAGAVEAAYAILALKNNLLPPTLNLETPSLESKIDRVANQARKTQKPLDLVMNNAFGFGGVNASLIFGRI